LHGRNGRKAEGAVLARKPTVSFSGEHAAKQTLKSGQPAFLARI
jgi:hypothetical protein